MTIDPTYRARIISEASALFDRGLLDPKTGKTILEAFVDDETFQALEHSVSSYQADAEATEILWSQQLWRAKVPGLFDATPPSRQTSDAAATALTRAWEMPFEEILDMGSFVQRVFDGIEKARTLPGTGPFQSATVRDEVIAVLADRLYSRILKGRQRASGTFDMLPPPRSDAFAKAIRRRFTIGRELYAGWTKMPLWDNILVRLFHTFMADGAIEDAKRPALELRFEEADLRRQWFDDLIARGESPRRILRSFHAALVSSPTDATLRAYARLGAFAPGVAYTPKSSAMRIGLLVREIEQLHAAGPELKEKAFLQLLPPLVSPFTFAGIREAIRQKDLPIDDFMIFRAATILMWHSAPSQGVADWLTFYVKRNKKYDSLDQFSKTMFGAPIDALQKKIDELAATAGVDVGPMVAAIREKFPKAKIRLPGSNSTPGGQGGTAVKDGASAGAKGKITRGGTKGVRLESRVFTGVVEPGPAASPTSVPAESEDGGVPADAGATEGGAAAPQAPVASGTGGGMPIR